MRQSMRGQTEEKKTGDEMADRGQTEEETENEETEDEGADR